LDFYKLRETGITLQKKSIKLQTFLESLITFSKPMIDNRPIQLINLIADDFPPITADENRLEQILYNLISNAVKFTKKGSISIDAKITGDKVSVSVCDTGIGIPKDQQSKIFDHFSQIDSAISRNYQGSGLGLSITKKLIELHQGTISVDSEEGKGACFTFTLPIIEPPEPAVDQHLLKKSLIVGYRPGMEQYPLSIELDSNESMLTTPQVGKKTILVIDDDVINLEILRSCLDKGNYQALFAQDGKTALEMIQRHRVDLVLLDLMMPKMSGFEVCSAIRERWGLITLPVIILSAKNQIWDLEEAFKVGANDYLTKPFQLKEVLLRINTHLKAKEAVVYLEENQRLSEEITLRKQLENDLRISQERLIGILNIEEDAIICLNQDFELVFFNRGAEQVFDYKASSIIQQESCVIFPNPKFKEKILKKTNTSMKEFCQLLIQPKNKTPYMVEAYLSTVNSKEESLITIVFPDHQRTHAKVNLVPDPVPQQDISLDLVQMNKGLLVQHDRMTALEEAMTGVYRLLSHKQIATGPISQVDVFDQEKRKLIVQSMNQALEYWEISTGNTKTELAEKSGIWHVRLEGGNFITRTLNRYLKLDQLPQKPRIREVIRTVNYVLDYCPTIKGKKNKLKQTLSELKALM
jgi:CheY-like chemotaxis protein/nitrogen-specific signal transduction histidine kinase